MPHGKHLSDEQKQALDNALRKYQSITDAAEAVGIGRTTANARAKKLRASGEKLPCYEAPAQPHGSVSPDADPIEIRDAMFWRRKAYDAEKKWSDCEHVLREMAGMVQRDVVVPEWTIPQPGKQGRAIGLLHLSDLHVGEVVRPEEIGGINAYNPEIFKERLRRMIAASTEILPRWSADCDLQGVVVALNGDLISGDIHDELRRSNALTAHEQVALVTDEIAAALVTLADRFGGVLVTVTPGNHGRATEKTHAKRMAALSYDTMVGTILAREFASDNRITINVSSGADMVFPLFGWSILQTHGDSMGTGGGQGFAGPELPIVRGGKKIKLAGFAAGEHYDIILTAHYHTSSNPGSVLANGSMVGMSEFGLRIRAVPEPPMQWLSLITERWGLRERMPVVLEDPIAPVRPKIRVPAGWQVSA